MTDDAATVRDELWWHEDLKDCGMCQDPEALAALDRLAARAARADELEISLRAWEDIADDETSRADRYEAVVESARAAVESVGAYGSMARLAADLDRLDEALNARTDA